MLYIEKMAPRRITGANYTTAVNGMVHPDRVMEEHDFLYVLDGEWEIWEEGQRYEMRTDDLLILAAGRHHYGKRLCSAGNRHMYFHVEPTARERKKMYTDDLKEDLRPVCEREQKKSVEDLKAVMRFAKEQDSGSSGMAVEASQEHATQVETFMDEMEAPRQPSPLFESATLVHCQHAPQVRRCFQELIASYWSQEPLREERLTLLFNLFLLELIGAQADCGSRAAKTDPIVAAVRERVSSNPQMFYRAKEMADQFYICPRTLNNRFQRACGMTFSAFQMDLKLEMVREFLRSQPDAKLHEAALNFGFYDEFHLSKAFRKKYGQPPSKARNRIDKPQSLD